MRRRSFVQLILLGLLVAAAVTAVAVLVPWLPPAASKQRDRIDFVFWFTTGIAIFIFSLVAAVILFSVVKFRVPEDDDTEGPPIHGHTGLEIAWTAVPAGLVTAIAIISAIVLTQNGRAGRSPLEVDVTAQQFAWTFTYRSGEAKGVVSPVLYLPLGQKVELRIASRDVIHSFWVPEFGQKQDAVPGAVNRLVITPTKLTDPKKPFPVICTELCGLGHALMRSEAIVLRPEAFAAWARKQAKPAAARPAPPPPSGGTQASAVGKKLFSSEGCVSCHTLKAAGATGTVGPVLDNLPTYAKRAGVPLEQFVKESIQNPGGYIEPGYQNVMTGAFPPLTTAQLDALVQFLVSASGGD